MATQRKETSFQHFMPDYRKATSYTSGSNRCILCLEGKFAILKADKQNHLNKRSELVSVCRYQEISISGKQGYGGVIVMLSNHQKMAEFPFPYN